MSDGTFRGRWVDEVFRNPSISDAVRVALLALVSTMTDAGDVSIPRGDLAARLSRSERRIDDRISAAVAAGLLARVARGQKHQTAVYRAVLPGYLSATPVCPAENPQRDGLQRAEPNPQRDGLQRAENPQRDTRGSHRSNLSATPGGRTKYIANATTSGQGEDGVVVTLFEEIKKKDQTREKKHTSESEEDPRFAEFWAAYPKHVAKGAARKAWDKAIKNGADPEAIILGARTYASSPRRRESDSKFTAHATTWLNGERWTDEPEAAPVARPTGYATNKHHESDAGAKLAEAFL